MNFDLLRDKGFAIFGQRGTGKSILVKEILSHERQHIVYDVMREHRGFNRYIPTWRQVIKHNAKDPAIIELNTFVNRVVLRSKQIRLFILEEANRFCPPKPTRLPSSILDVNDFCRHERLSWGIVARRPVQVHTDLVELAHYLFIFRLVGKNDIEYLETIAEGLGEAVKKLPEYHFVIAAPDRSFEVHSPVPYKESEAIS